MQDYNSTPPILSSLTVLLLIVPTHYILIRHSDDNTNDNDNDSLVEEELHSSQESSSSITCEDYDYVVRKAGILDFLKRTMATEQPHDVSKYDQKFVNVQDLFSTLQMYIPKMDTTYNAGQVSR
ncbi:hypothetical protein [Absidia glauca]|uniref:Uncharacterized protein n=1 Tax=Absidia glauca TaxID=4829 RepID=A0A168RZI1_ABSGL|nr:hypothetical protein [Absidia glauca]